MKRLLLGTASLIAAAAVSPACAADLAVKAPIAPAVTFSWTGCYIGANGGGGWGSNKWNDPALGDFLFASHDLSGWAAGGQVGCNYQTGIWVFGAEVDGDYANLNGFGPDLVQPGGLTDNVKIDAIGSVTGRVGVTWERALFYIKAGGAVARNNFFATDPTGATVATADQTRWGFAVGGGWEWAFADHLSFKVEYEYMDFGRQSATLLGPAGGSFNIDQMVHLLKIGVNHRFGWEAPAPVVTRY